VSSLGATTTPSGCCTSSPPLHPRRYVPHVRRQNDPSRIHSSKG
jgi:hypothetical protein